MFILLEGLDKTGKSTIASKYEKRGYKVVHIGAPDKKYYEDGYSGPDYVNELVELYMQYDGQDTVFDRTIYGELVWPYVHKRKALLSDEDLEYLKEYEERNNAKKFLMVDNNVDAHWQRCVASKDSLTKAQFMSARAVYLRLSKEQGFILRQLGDFDNDLGGAPTAATEPKTAEAIEDAAIEKASAPVNVNRLKTKEQLKLEKANVINDILSKPILKSKGSAYQEIENELRTFLNSKLALLFGQEQKPDHFSNDEVQLLKMMCKQLKDKSK